MEVVCLALNDMAGDEVVTREVEMDDNEVEEEDW